MVTKFDLVLVYTLECVCGCAWLPLLKHWTLQHAFVVLTCTHARCMQVSCMHACTYSAHLSLTRPAGTILDVCKKRATFHLYRWMQHACSIGAENACRKWSKHSSQARIPGTHSPRILHESTAPTETTKKKLKLYTALSFVSW